MTNGTIIAELMPKIQKWMKVENPEFGHDMDLLDALDEVLDEARRECIKSPAIDGLLDKARMDGKREGIDSMTNALRFEIEHQKKQVRKLKKKLHVRISDLRQRQLSCDLPDASRIVNEVEQIIRHLETASKDIEEIFPNCKET